MLSPEKNFKPLQDDALTTVYMAEVRALDRVAKTPGFDSLICKLTDYQALLESTEVSGAPESLKENYYNDGIIKASDPSDEVQQLLGLAQLAACSVLFNGARLQVNSLKSEHFMDKQQDRLLKSLQTDGTNSRQNLMQRLVGMDAVRTMQLLRFAGIFLRPDNECVQLGLGAATGNKDIHFAHAQPACQLLSAGNDRTILFNYRSIHPRDVIISDLDPRHQKLYDKLEALEETNARGYVSDTFRLLDKLAESNGIKRNLVTMLRIEPAMIPDAHRFLGKLARIIDDGCDLVISIGAGDSPTAYHQRIEKISEIHGLLTETGLKPTLFKLHMGGTIMQQAASLQFGNAATASYEILHCKLNPGILSNAFTA